jgi:hypothetical protein
MVSSDIQKTLPENNIVPVGPIILSRNSTELHKDAQYEPYNMYLIYEEACKKVTFMHITLAKM